MLISAEGNTVSTNFIEYTEITEVVKDETGAAVLDEDGNEVQRALQLCLEKKPMGILFLGGNSAHFREDFSQIDIPCVLVTNDASELGFPNLSSVCTDDRNAARCAIDALVAQGHRQIAMIGGDRDVSEISRLRYEGCMEAFQAYGIRFDGEKDY